MLIKARRGLRTAGKIRSSGALVKTLWGVVCAAWAAACLYSFTAHPLEAGAAKVEIVPAPGAPLDGDFERRGRPATGSRDSLYVRALFLQDDNTSCFIVVADLFAISSDLRARVLELAPGSVPRENIVLVATHTLNGPGGLDRSWLGRQRGGRFMPEHVEGVAAKFGEAMQLAYDSRKRAAAGYAAVDAPLAVNQFDPLAPVDSRLSVLRIDDSDGNPIAILANAGVAPQALKSLSFSADFPGAFCAALEAMTAMPSIAFFLNGASADQIAAPADGGQPFADALAARVKGMANEISCREVSLRLSTITTATPLHSAAPFYSAEALLHAVEIDRLALLFLPAIPRGAVGTELRKALTAQGYAQSMIVAPANGYLGGVSLLENFGWAGAGSEPVYLGPDAGEWLVGRVAALLSESDTAAPQGADSSPPALIDATGIIHVSASGVPQAVGAERGRVLRGLDMESDLPVAWLDHAAGSVLGHWQLTRSAVSVEAIALPIAAESTRGLLRGLSSDTIAALAGMSNAAHEPFAHLWLRQFAPSADAPVPVGPVGVAFSLSTSDVGIVLGQSIEWPTDSPVVLSRVHPKSGRPYVIAGLPWHVGGVAGVNDRGVAAAVAPSNDIIHSAVSLPAETILAEVLSAASSLDEAIAILGATRPELAGRILLVHDDGTTSRTAVVDLGVLPSVALDIATEVVVADEATPAPREIRVRRLLEGLGVPSADDADKVLVDRDRRAVEADRVLSPVTRACVVIVPRRHELRVMAPQDGTPRVFEAISVRGDES
jgi:hypothetical protein